MIHRIEKKLGMPELVEKLASRISASELNTLLLEVFRLRAHNMTATDLMQQYRQNRFVSPSGVDAIEFLEQELRLLKAAFSAGFAPVQISPLAPLGCCSALAPVDQGKIVSALRGTEVVADATNVLALHAAAQKKGKGTTGMLRYCAAHRHVRAQAFSGKGQTAHFGIHCMVTAGRDTGSYSFEKQSFLEHLSFYLSVLRGELGSEHLFVKVRQSDGYADAAGLKDRLLQAAQERHPGVPIVFDPEWNRGNAYYKGFQFKVFYSHNGMDLDLADGGFVDWTQQLLQNKKERMFISALGTELLYKIRNGTL